MKNLSLALILSLFLVLVGCTDGGDDFRTSCGAVRDGDEVVNPVNEDDGEAVTITSFTNGNILTIREDDTGDLILIVLHGIATTTNERAIEQAREYALDNATGARFYPATDDCTIDIGSFQELIPGQIILADGTSLAEELLIQGWSRSDDGNECSSDLIENCFQGLELESSPTPSPSITPTPSATPSLTP